eukprot:9281381-Prorocentrum_lima.AAC.1
MQGSSMMAAEHIQGEAAQKHFDKAEGTKPGARQRGIVIGPFNPARVVMASACPSIAQYRRAMEQ